MKIERRQDEGTEIPAWRWPDGEATLPAGFDKRLQTRIRQRTGAQTSCRFPCAQRLRPIGYTASQQDSQDNAEGYSMHTLTSHPGLIESYKPVQAGPRQLRVINISSALNCHWNADNHLLWLGDTDLSRPFPPGFLPSCSRPG